MITDMFCLSQSQIGSFFIHDFRKRFRGTFNRPSNIIMFVRILVQFDVQQNDGRSCSLSLVQIPKEHKKTYDRSWFHISYALLWYMQGHKVKYQYLIILSNSLCNGNSKRYWQDLCLYLSCAYLVCALTYLLYFATMSAFV